MEKKRRASSQRISVYDTLFFFFFFFIFFFFILYNAKLAKCCFAFFQSISQDHKLLGALFPTPIGILPLDPTEGLPSRTPFPNLGSASELFLFHSLASSTRPAM